MFKNDDSLLEEGQTGHAARWNYEGRSKSTDYFLRKKLEYIQE
jgi:hypothetical protein